MKKNLIMLSTLILVFILKSTAFADCAPGSTWTASWTDQYGQTSYSLEAPCVVYIGIPFSITAKVTDSTYPNSYVACMWSITDNGTVIASGSGLGWLATVNGSWQDVLTETYTGTPVNHTVQFSFLDLGQGGGAHFWGAKVIGNVIVDPYPTPVNNPPTADAGPDIYLTTDEQNLTVIQGQASDSDGDPLTYRWLEGSTVLLSTTPTDASGSAPLNLAVVPPLSRGSHVFTLEVSDGTTTATDTVTVSVGNSAPVAAPSGGGTYEIGDPVSLGGQVSDFDGDTVSYKWMEGQTILGQGQVATSAGGSPAQLPAITLTGLSLGSHTITLVVSDGIDTGSGTITVNVIDTIAPTLAPAASTNILWPPNGNMTQVTINANAHDNSGGPIVLSVLVSSSEAPRTDRYGNVIPDYTITSIDQSTGTVVLQLRSSRSGKSGDRIYSVTITATDASANSSSAQLSIKVPHDRGLHKGAALGRRR